MRWIGYTGRRSRRILVLLGTLLALSGTLPGAAHATSQQPTGTGANTTTIAVRSGNATAIAQCLTLAKDGTDSTRGKDRWCYNYAYARGGKVFIKDVEIVVGQANDEDGLVAISRNTVNFTVRGGDATAIATCVNAGRDGKKPPKPCVNVAIAVGGNVILTNVRVTLVQGQ